MDHSVDKKLAVWSHAKNEGQCIDVWVEAGDKCWEIGFGTRPVYHHCWGHGQWNWVHLCKLCEPYETQQGQVLGPSAVLCSPKQVQDRWRRIENSPAEKDSRVLVHNKNHWSVHHAGWLEKIPTTTNALMSVRQIWRGVSFWISVICFLACFEEVSCCVGRMLL